MQVNVFKSEEIVFQGEAEKVVLPAAEGEITILPHHVSIVTNLKSGRLIVFKSNNDQFQTKIEGGVASFINNCLSVLVGNIDFSNKL